MRKILCLALAASLAAVPAGGATLENFEKNATLTGDGAARGATQRGGRAGHGGRLGGSRASGAERILGAELAESLGEVLIYGIVGGLFYGGAASWARVTQPAAPEPEVGEPGEAEDGTERRPEIEVGPRRPGEALIPFARLDAGYQIVAADVSALDLRAEAGYAMAAVQVRRTDYRENNPKDDLTTTAIHGLYRMSFGDHFEMDIGLGALVLQRAGSHSGFSFTLPLLFHPSERFGIEFRPAWSDLGGSTIEDYDVAILAGRRHVSARAGYRWVRAGSAWLDGPEIGIAVRW